VAAELQDWSLLVMLLILGLWMTVFRFNGLYSGYIYLVPVSHNILKGVFMMFLGARGGYGWMREITVALAAFCGVWSWWSTCICTITDCIMR
jgi:hypothetical protein